MENPSAIVLAIRGEGQMKSSKAEVMHEICGKPIIGHVLDTVKASGISNCISVVGHKFESVVEYIKDSTKYIIEEKRLGTGHAVIQTKKELKDCSGNVIILNGNMPLIKPETIKKIIGYHIASDNVVTIVTTVLDNADGCTRIVRDGKGEVLKITEYNNATEKEKMVQEVNSEIYCFKTENLFKTLNMMDNDTLQSENYLTDAIAALIQNNDKVGTYVVKDSDELRSINDRIQLSEAEFVMRKRILRYHMKNGVTIIDPNNTYIHSDVLIGEDTLIYPGTFLEGGTIIGKDCVIGPNSRIINSNISDYVVVQNSVVLDSSIGDETKVGPFAYIRPGSNIGKNVKVGDFVEIKKSIIGDGTKISHLSYVGDAELGKNVNMGCGSIIVNYDGQEKHKTVVGDNSFVGCNVNLVSPVVVNKNSFIAAGSTITKEVPEDALAIARSRQEIKEGWAKKRRSKS
jgi:bifunctional UDP-N-acetylglucosamine pyrophosphorylase/glucosamine-1-phosphate N-acetyltransferase